ncbi:MAG: hypothetical protein ABJL99_17530 [Aliishimia sp.]
MQRFDVITPKTETFGTVFATCPKSYNLYAGLRTPPQKVAPPPIRAFTYATWFFTQSWVMRLLHLFMIDHFFKVSNRKKTIVKTMFAAVLALPSAMTALPAQNATAATYAYDIAYAFPILRDARLGAFVPPALVAVQFPGKSRLMMILRPHNFLSFNLTTVNRTAGFQPLTDSPSSVSCPSGLFSP